MSKDSEMLKIGYMLQFSEKEKSLEEKLRLVTSYYTRKAGKSPEFIVINDKVEYPEKFGNVDVLRRKWIMKNYFWVGVYGYG